MPNSQLDIWVPWIATVLDAIAMFLVVRRRLWQQLPAFSWYLVFGFVSGVLFWIVKFNFRAYYFYFYYAVDITFKVLNFWVTYEIYSRLMNSFPALRQMAWRVLWVSGVILLATSALVYKLTNFQGVPGEMIALFTLGRSFRVVQLGLLSVIFLIVRSFHLRLRRYYAFIAIGLVIIDSFEFVGLSTYLSEHRHIFLLVDHVRMICSVAVTGLWIIVLWVGEGEVPSTTPSAYAALPVTELENWNLALKETRLQ